MLITKEQQEALIDNYIKEGHNIDECTAFIDGLVKTIELLERIDKRRKDYERGN